MSNAPCWAVDAGRVVQATIVGESCAESCRWRLVWTSDGEAAYWIRDSVTRT